MHLLVSYWKTKHRSVPTTDTFSLSSHIAAPDQNAPAGGIAAFGWFDSGEVRLLQYVEYLPSIQFAQTHRALRPAKLLIEIGDLPRYAMVCAWRNVRVQNAEGKFAGKDYCKEIAESKASSVAWWWPGPGK